MRSAQELGSGDLSSRHAAEKPQSLSSSVSHIVVVYSMLLFQVLHVSHGSLFPQGKTFHTFF